MLRTTTVRLPEPLHAELREFCEERGAVMSRVVTIAVREYLGDERAPALPVQPPGEPNAMRFPPGRPDASLRRKRAPD
jgi:hypothetical protein